MIKALLMTSLVILASLQLLLSSQQVQRERQLRASQATLFFLPPAKALRLAVLDFDNLAADLIWVKTILYFSEQFMGRRDFRYLERLLNLITDLDPRFEKAYIWASAAFVYNGNLIRRANIEASNRILLKGWDYYNESLVKWRISDDFWRIPFSIGFNYAIELRDKVKGAPYLRAASMFPQTPEYMRTMAATFLRKSGDYVGALDALEEQLTIESLRQSLELTTNSQQKDELNARIKMLYNKAAEKQINMATIYERQLRLSQLYRTYQREFRYLPISFYQSIYLPPAFDLSMSLSLEADPASK